MELTKQDLVNMDVCADLLWDAVHNGLSQDALARFACACARLNLGRIRSYVQPGDYDRITGYLWDFYTTADDVRSVIRAAEAAGARAEAAGDTDAANAANAVAEAASATYAYGPEAAVRPAAFAAYFASRVDDAAGEVVWMLDDLLR